MPSTCSVIGCNATSSKVVHVHRFPAYPPDRNRLWIIAINRVNTDCPTKLWCPGKNGRVCSRHFVTGKPVCDPDHVDWVPTLYLRRQITPASTLTPPSTALQGGSSASSIERLNRRKKRKPITLGKNKYMCYICYTE